MNKVKQAPLTTTKAQALDLGRHYLQTLGYNAFSFQLIADELGIKKASLHYHFASKEDLGLALIADYEAAYIESVEKMKDLSALQKLTRMTRIFCRMSQDQKKLCPLGVLAVDFNTVPAKMQKRLLDFHKIQQNWLITTLKQGLKEKSLKKDLDLNFTADLILAAIQGGLLMARVRGESATLENMLEKLIKDIKR
ncbi:MAG: TetR/AcrR family transcriptional regulator [Bdellovibrio sp.]|nr:TetR/AcrR family transcriptional regulator [Bdellovibrio sp.]